MINRMQLIKTSKIMVGLSGGVDSSVTAYLLKQQGHDIQAVFMQNWQQDGKDKFCLADQDLQDAQAVCKLLDIPLQTVSFSAEYWDKVFQNFLDEYAAGRTPNPDILCNKEIKFRAFLNYALTQGAAYIATGHYARIHQENGQYRLLKGLDRSKDQSYFLYTLQQQQLAYSLFPLGALPKTEVRQIAKKIGLVNHAKKDSTGICFIGERRFRDFLSEYLLARPGVIETLEGEKIGEHQGLMFYTLGQRQGLGIGGLRAKPAAPWYVITKDLKRNVLVVGQCHNHPQLLNASLCCSQLYWVAGKEPDFPLTCTAKTRYRQQDAACVVNKSADNALKVSFAQPQRAVTPGQSVVFYQGEECLGGGVIV